MLVAGLLGEAYGAIGLAGIIGFCVLGVLITGGFRLNYLKKTKAAAAAA